MIRFLIVLLFFVTVSLSAAELPPWASAVVTETAKSTPPKDASFWTLLDRTQIAQKANGKWVRSRQLVRRVLKQSGGVEASIYAIDGQAGSTKIKKIKGWHRGTDGKVTTLDKDNVATFGLSFEALTNEKATMAYFENVNRGDLVVFQSEEVEDNYFSLSMATLLGGKPVLRREIVVSGEGRTSQPVLKTIGLDDWSITAEQTGNTLILRNLPGLDGELLSTGSHLHMPYVLFGYLEGPQDPMSSWDALARWYAPTFEKASGVSLGPVQPVDKTALEAVAQDLAKRLSYQQVYLTDARGYEPIAGKEVARRAYGDCKDLVSALAWALEPKGIRVVPALNGPFVTQDTPTQRAHDHVIAAIPLPTSLGYASEVEVGGQRYVLYDPTARHTPLGTLPWGLKGRSFMICTRAGALWVKPAATAFENAALRLTLQGQVDQEYTLSGQLEVVVQGDAHGLHSLAKEGNAQEMTQVLRTILILPGLAKSSTATSTTNADGTLTVQMNLHWPSFLRRDSGGVRFPKGITGDSLGDLERLGRPRQLPIWIAEQPPVAWQIQLALPDKLTPQKTEVSWDGPFGQFSWKAQTGDIFTVETRRSSKDVFYPRAKLKEGLAAWEQHQKESEAFFLEAALFYF